MSELAIARRRAFALGALALSLAVLFICVSLSPLACGFADKPSRGVGDVELYRAEIMRMRAGEGYYEAAAAELPARGYPTSSPFNWRTPLPTTLIAAVDNDTLGRCVICLAAIGFTLFAFGLLDDTVSRTAATIAMLAASGVALPCFVGDCFVMSEVWAGLLIGLATLAFGFKRAILGVVLAVAALFVRELAAPFVVIYFATLLVHRRWTALAVGAGLMAAYAAFYAWHLGQIAPLLGSPLATGGGWVRFGGLGFLISTVQMNAYLLLLPQWVAAIYLAIAMVGCFTARGAEGTLTALSVVAYCLAFSIAGNDFNQYWGSTSAPLLCLAFARGASALVQSLRLVLDKVPLTRFRAPALPAMVGSE